MGKLKSYKDEKSQLLIKKACEEYYEESNELTVKDLAEKYNIEYKTLSYYKLSKYRQTDKNELVKSHEQTGGKKTKSLTKKEYNHSLIMEDYKRSQLETNNNVITSEKPKPKRQIHINLSDLILYNDK